MGLNGEGRRFFRTLLADSSSFMDVALERALEAQGHLVFRAATAKAALDLTRRLQPDLILLDSGLAGSHDMRLLGELLVEQTSAAVIVLARDASISQAVEAIRTGALDYMERPLDLERLARVCGAQKDWNQRDSQRPPGQIIPLSPLEGE